MFIPFIGGVNAKGGKGDEDQQKPIEKGKPENNRVEPVV